MDSITTVRTRLSGTPLSLRPAADPGTSPGPGVVGGRTATTRAVLRIRPLSRELVTFAAIGVASTVAYVVLYSALRAVCAPAVANALALVATAVGNTAANRRLTFGVRGRERLARDQAAGLIAFAVALGITTGAVALLQALAPGAGRALELAVLIAANAMATVVRFLLLRSWISTRGEPRPIAPSEQLEGSAR